MSHPPWPVLACFRIGLGAKIPAKHAEEAMAAAPVPPVAIPSPAPEQAPLSEVARIVNTFIAPTKTFTDLRRNAAWWAPFLLMVAVSTVFVYTAGQKIGFRKIMENQMQAQPKQQARLEQLPPDQREEQMQKGAKVTQVISYTFPLITLIIWLIIASALFATFKFAAGADVSFKVSLAIVIYAALPLMLKSLLAMLSVVAGMSPDSFSFQNPIASNPGYFMNPADNIFLYSVASGIDIFMIWTLVLTAIGFICVSKVKHGTAYGIVFGWWLVFTLIGAAMGAAFS
jgi:Yip1 domain